MKQRIIKQPMTSQSRIKLQHLNFKINFNNVLLKHPMLNLILLIFLGCLIPIGCASNNPTMNNNNQTNNQEHHHTSINTDTDITLNQNQHIAVNSPQNTQNLRQSLNATNSTIILKQHLLYTIIIVAFDVIMRFYSKVFPPIAYTIKQLAVFWFTDNLFKKANKQASTIPLTYRLLYNLAFFFINGPMIENFIIRSFFGGYDELISKILVPLLSSISAYGLFTLVINQARKSAKNNPKNHTMTLESICDTIPSNEEGVMILDCPFWDALKVIQD